VVFELAACGDPAATAIVDAAAAALTGLVGSVVDVLKTSLPVVLGGGVLVHQPALSTRVGTALASRGLDDIRVLDRDPAHGAAVLAAALLPEPVTS
jgi:N-acetylglucosamine kinase-like BadF-type ATPase